MREDDFWNHIDNGHVEFANPQYNKSELTVIIPNTERPQMEAWNEYYKTWKAIVDSATQSQGAETGT